MTDELLEEMGPVDYIVLEWPGRQPKGDVAPLIIDAVDRGLIRILDVALMVKGEDGSVAALDLGELDDDAGFSAFSGASSGLIAQEDLEEAASALEPGTAAAILMWENRWAAPIAVALRKSGGQLVASGRIPVQGILAALEAMEAETAAPESGDQATCQDYFAGLPAPLPSPVRRPPSPTASRAGRRTAGPPRSSPHVRRAAVRRAASRTRSPQADPIAQLRELAKLRDDGILTEEEFAAEKHKILG